MEDRESLQEDTDSFQVTKRGHVDKEQGRESLQEVRDRFQVIRRGQFAKG
jgi:hypothetical protein